jgi:hypothetical protein
MPSTGDTSYAGRQMNTNKVQIMAVSNLAVKCIIATKSSN